MFTTPDLKHFTQAFAKGTPQLLTRTLLCDSITPLMLLNSLQELGPQHVLLESVEGGQVRGRYSILAADPDLLWICEEGRARAVSCAPGTQAPDLPEAPFASLRALLRASHLTLPAHMPPMLFGLFGYMGYGMVQQMEQLPNSNPDHTGIPEAVYMRPQLVVVLDNVSDVLYLATPVWHQEGVSPKEAWEQGCKRLDRAEHLLRRAAPLPPQALTPGAQGKQRAKATAAIDQNAYAKIVEKAKAYIRAGDIFQVVPSRRLRVDFPSDPHTLYRALRHLNPSPYLFYMQLQVPGQPPFSLVGSSPEILVRVKEGVVTIRPIAGTRKRGANEAEDQALEAELLADGKECAEHLMLLDLGRNDVGRVATKGSVRVSEQMVVERYSHVMHIVSNVEGTLREDKDVLDALIAGFPAGTVSGAPKIRAMEIIDELESEARSFYGGTVGYITPEGQMDTCIALRTGLVKEGVLHVQAGGGIVADSNPRAEFEETENKAGALLAAAALAQELERGDPS